MPQRWLYSQQDARPSCRSGSLDSGGDPGQVDWISTASIGGRFGIGFSIGLIPWPPGVEGIDSEATMSPFSTPAHASSPRELDVGAADTITADRLVIAAGSRPVVPDLHGLTSVDYHTSDTVMRLPELPRSMIIIGGGYISAEFAHIFSAFGTSVTVLNRSKVLLRREDADVAKRFTDLLDGELMSVWKQVSSSSNRRLKGGYAYISTA